MSRKPTKKQVAFAEQYAITGNGKQSAEIAGYTGSDNVLRSIASENLTKPSVIHLLDDKKTDLVELFRDNAQTCFQVLMDIVNNDKMSVFARLSAAKDILDRAGYKPTDKTEVSGEVMLSTEHTRAIAQRARMLIQNKSE